MGLSRFTWPECEGRLQDRAPAPPGRSCVSVLEKGWGRGVTQHRDRRCTVGHGDPGGSSDVGRVSTPVSMNGGPKGLLHCEC